MKYLKLFEDKEWWEEESPFDDLEDTENIEVGDWVIILIDSVLTMRKNSIGIVRIKQGRYYDINIDGKFFVYKENEIRKLTREEKKKYGLIKEQLDEWDPFEEENKEDLININIGDWVIVSSRVIRNNRIILSSKIGIVDYKSRTGKSYRIKVGDKFYGHHRNSVRKLTREEKRKYGLIKEQLDEFDPFGEETEFGKKKGFKIGDLVWFMDYKNIMRLGTIEKITITENESVYYTIRTRNNLVYWARENEVIEIDPDERRKLREAGIV